MRLVYVSFKAANNIYIINKDNLKSQHIDILVSANQTQKKTPLN